MLKPYHKSALKKGSHDYVWGWQEVENDYCPGRAVIWKKIEDIQEFVRNDWRLLCIRMTAGIVNSINEKVR